jgi:hypothetical protein
VQTRLQRYSDQFFTVPVTNSSATSAPIDFSSYAAGQVEVPAGSGLTLLTWYSSTDGKTFVPVQDGTGGAATSVVSASMSCLIPAACFACRYLMAVGNTSGNINLNCKT